MIMAPNKDGVIHVENAIDKTTFTVRVNSETKKKADEVASNLGITLTAAINLFVEQFVREEGMPFRPTTKTTVYSESDLSPAFVKDLKNQLRVAEDEPGYTVSQVSALLDAQLKAGTDGQ